MSENKTDCFIQGGDEMKLRDLRKAKRLTQAELASCAGVTQPYIGALERGEKKNPSVVVVKGLAKGLGVSIARVLEALDEAV